MPKAFVPRVALVVKSFNESNANTSLQVKQFDWLAKSNDITAGSNVCGLRFNWRGSWLAVPRPAADGGVNLLPRSSGWDPPRLLSCPSLADKEAFTTVAWRRDDSMLIAGTNKVSTCLVRRVWSAEVTEGWSPRGFRFTVSALPALTALAALEL